MINHEKANHLLQFIRDTPVPVNGLIHALHWAEAEELKKRNVIEESDGHLTRIPGAPTTIHQTVRDFLSRFNYSERIETDSKEYLSLPVAWVDFCVNEAGGLYAYAGGGVAIMAFMPVGPRRPLLLIVKGETLRLIQTA